MLKNFTIVLFSLFVFSTYAQASQMPCSNMAKFEAIRRYKAEMGTVQGSEGVQHSAHLVAQKGSIFEYVVTLADNNEDGEYWEVDYHVRLEARNQTCRIIAVKKGATH